MANENLYTVKKTCPMCGEETRVTKVKSRLITEKTDWDYCTHYKDMNPYLYTVWVCEHCGYAADEQTFTKYMPETRKKPVQEFLASRRVDFKYNLERSVPEAVASYKLAMYYAELTDDTLAHQAGLNLKLAWIFRIAGIKNQEQQFLAKAAELYERSVATERYPIGQLSDTMAIFITGACHYLLGDMEKATQSLSRLIGDQSVRTSEPRIYDRARDLWQDVRDGH